MKLATYERDGAQKVGAVIDGDRRIVDLAACVRAGGGDGAPFSSMLALIESGARGLDGARAALASSRAGDFSVALDSVRLRAPLPVPQQIRDFSVFATHVRQAPAGMQKLAARLQGREPPDVQPAPEPPPVYVERPIYYLSNRFSVAGPDDVVNWPRYSAYMDYETELAMVVGATGKNIPVEKAGDYIFGYTLFNDFSARDAQFIEMQSFLGAAKGKSFDNGNAFGPWIVTKDDIPDVRALELAAHINGAEWTRGRMDAMMHSFEAMIAYVSRDETIHAGEIFGSGTVGNGCGLERDRYLPDGAVVEISAPGLGVLRNTVRRQA